MKRSPYSIIWVILFTQIMFLFGGCSSNDGNNTGSSASANLLSTALIESVDDTMTIGNYVLVSKVQVGRTAFDYTYKASVTNTSFKTAQNVTADLNSNVQTTIVINGSLTFGDVAPGQTVSSQNTFTVRIDRAYTFNASDIVWTIRAVMPEAAGIVGANGGVVQVIDSLSKLNGVGVNIPAGALSSNTNISIGVPTFATLLPGNLTNAGIVLELLPHGLTFTSPVQISLKYTDNNNDGIIDGTNVQANQIKVITTDDYGKIEYLPIVNIDTTNHLITATTTHFSQFSVVAQANTYKAYFSDSSTWISDSYSSSPKFDYLKQSAFNTCAPEFCCQGLALFTRAGTDDRVKYYSKMLSYSYGSYTWHVYIPSDLTSSEKVSIGAFLYAGDYQEIDFEIGYGTTDERNTYKNALSTTISDKDLMVYMTNQAQTDPLGICDPTNTCTKIDKKKMTYTTVVPSIVKGYTNTKKIVTRRTIKSGKWHDLKISFERINDISSNVSWSIDGELLQSTIVDFAPPAFKVYCSVENLDFMGDKKTSVDRYGYFASVDYVSYTSPTSPASPITLNLTKLASMPDAHDGPGIWQYGGKIYLFGGYGFAGMTSRLDVYDPSNDSWSTPTTISSPGNRHTPASFAIGASLYSVGGEGPYPGGFTNAVYKYDTSTHIWSSIGLFPTTTFGKKAVTVNGNVYILDGRRSYGSSDSAMYMYDSQSNNWISKAPIPYAVSQGGLVSYDSKIWVFGGDLRPSESQTIYTRKIQVYDPTTNSWNYVSDMPYYMANIDAVLINGSAWLIPNYVSDDNGNTYIINANRIYQYNFNSQTWQQYFVNLPSTLTLMGVGDNQIIAIGKNIYFTDFRTTSNSYTPDFYILQTP